MATLKELFSRFLGKENRENNDVSASRSGQPTPSGIGTISTSLAKTNPKNASQANALANVLDTHNTKIYEEVLEDAEDGDELLRQLLLRVRQVELRTRKAVNSHAQGAYHARFKGRGMVFSESRAYAAGDDPRHIDWNATARSDGELFVKQFIEERELVLLLAIDISASLSFGTSGQAKRHLAAEAAAMLAFSALQNRDKVGLLTFSDAPERIIQPQRSRSHVLRVLREVLSAAPTGRGTDMARALEVLPRLSKQRAIVALITDFIDSGKSGAEPFSLSSSVAKQLRIIAHKHDLLVIEIEDPAEQDLPDVGLLSVRDPETGQEALVDTSNPAARQMYAQRMRSEKHRLREQLSRLGISHVSLRCGDDADAALIRFLRHRAQKT